jgi:hypothetical protein
VLGKIGEEEERARIEISSKHNQRRVWGASQARGKRCLSPRPQQITGKRFRLVARARFAH